jgi:uncharacterized cupredoxin-like copper-binding protein
MKKLAALLLSALVSTALVACGGGDDTTTTESAGQGGGATTTEEAEKGGGSGGGGATLSFEADPGGDLAYTTTEASTEAGAVTVDFNNPQALIHDVVIEDSGGKEIGGTEQVASEETSTTVNLKPGKYTFFCSVPGHREAGMEGTLTVK